MRSSTLKYKRWRRNGIYASGKQKECVAEYRVKGGG